MTHYVLDTNIVSLLLRRDTQVVSRFLTHITDSDRIIGCPVVWFELERGLLALDAKSQIGRFRQLFATFDWQEFSTKDWAVAAQWWVDRRNAGLPIGDADLLIAAYTHNRNATLVTDNEKDFQNLDLTVVNWKK
jgi:tRNA(fMet)-specific endonuclease VapC